MPSTVEIPDYDVQKRVSLDPASTALVIIDMQNDFVRDEGTLQVGAAPGDRARDRPAAGAGPRERDARGFG